MVDKKLLEDMGRRIKITRKKLRMTQEELAEKMDVSIQMISNLELGKKAIRPENVVKLCDALNVSADYIFTGKITEFETSQIFKKYCQLPIEKRDLIDGLINSML